MYRIFKPAGAYSEVTLENTDTKANIIIGKVSMTMLKILAETGMPSMDGLTAEEWNLEVNKECAKALADLTMRMSKPIRDQRKIVIEKKENKQIDAMDVLLGLASYN